MKLLQVVPDSPYMIWQLYVQMTNFRQCGIEENAIILVSKSYGSVPSVKFKEFQAWTQAKVYFFDDLRASVAYMPSIRPHIISQYYKQVDTPEVIFYHDQDILFIEPPRLWELEEGNVCYVSPGAASYLDTKYLKQFKKYIYYTMADIVGISTDIIEANDKNCGGAQYIIKNVDYAFWEKVESDCEGLYKYMCDITNEGLKKYCKTHEVPHPDKNIQKWCADMWALLWNMMGVGKEIKQSALIDFCWPWEDKDKAKPIFHNAGVTEFNENDIDGNPVLFNKGRYTQKWPLGKQFGFVDNRKVQDYYVSIIRSINFI